MSDDPVFETEVICWSKTITADDIEYAYARGVFPWPISSDDSEPIPWVFPSVRAVLFFKDLHISRSTKRSLKKYNFEFKVNTAFDKVIRNCAVAYRENQDDTWICSRMVEAYTEAHQRGKVLSFETWLDGELVGGMYGVLSKNGFSGESMFHTVTSASKFALINAIKYLNEKYNFEWIDIQQLTPLLKSFGATEISAQKFLTMILLDD